MRGYPGHHLGFDHHGHRVAAAEAQAADAALAAGAVQLVDERYEYARAAGADRVAKGHAAAADV